MIRVSTHQVRKLFPVAVLALGAFAIAAAPVNIGVSGIGMQQAYAKGGAEGGSADRGADKGSAEGSSADRSADKGSAETGATGAAEANSGSVDSASHDINDR